MAGLFGGKKVKAPKVPPPPAIPEAQEPEDVLKRRGRGFRKTILTGSLVPETGKKATLG